MFKELQRILTTWRTSLMGSEVAKLEALSTDETLRSFVKTIHIEDDCEKNDPWNTLEPFRFPNIWPRNKAGSVLSDQIGVASLRSMLKEGKLRPLTIVVRDYRISPLNSFTCPSTSRNMNYGFGGELTAPDLKPAPALAKDVLDGIALNVLSITMRQVKLPKRSEVLLPVSEPCVTEVTVKMSLDHDGCVAFSSLRSAELLVIPFWLDQVCYRAPNLEILKIKHSNISGSLPAGGPQFTNLQQLDLSYCKFNGGDLLDLTMASKRSLSSVSLHMTTMTDDSTWQDLLSTMGHELSGLESFTLRILKGGGELITFYGFDEQSVPEDCRSGLYLLQKGPPEIRRLDQISYKGPHAARILETVSRYATPWKV
ncbi:hypothetical protein D6C78_09426 [Aureobasidium pullulans]|uniref:Uncharacterized protein n=1 Tax=Aureobasidium pullulans TaxID=5580 RepID=A0A4T0B8Z5_AURPU|nr:hypothetical protein D6C78_09426 [Aureobasidium pullulans]